MKIKFPTSFVLACVVITISGCKTSEPHPSDMSENDIRVHIKVQELYLQANEEIITDKKAEHKTKEKELRKLLQKPNHDENEAKALATAYVNLEDEIKIHESSIVKHKARLKELEAYQAKDN